MYKLMLSMLILLSSGSLWAQTKSDDRGSDKLDLKKLEDKYWAAKDTDMAVVQNRTYSKEKKYFISASYGPLVNDPYSYGRMTNFSAGYYFTERWGLEVAYENGSLKDNDSTTEIRGLGGYPNFNRFKNYTSLNAMWVPFYAKMSFLDRQIMYFDMQFSLGVGQQNFEHQVDSSDGGSFDGKAVGYNFDFTQNLFFAKNFSFRLDIKNKWTNQEIYKANIPGNNASSEKLKSTMVQDTSILFGIMAFY